MTKKPDPTIPPALRNLPKNLPPGEYVVAPDGKVTPVVSKRGGPMKRLRRDPLEGHPRAEETRRLMREAHIDDEVEVMDLQASELACKIADAFVRMEQASVLQDRAERTLDLDALVRRLELVTRASAMRRVRR